MNICLFEQREINMPLALKDERAEHLIKVLHKKKGESFTAGIIGGKSGTAVITEISDAVYFEFTETGNGKPLENCIMIIGFPRPIQLKRLLRDIAALGVKEVHLTGTELGEKSYMKSNLVERGSAYKMLLDGTVQAGSTHVPELFMHQTLTECLESLEKTDGTECTTVKLGLDNVRPSVSLSEALLNARGFECAVAAIGSERGWTDRERDMLERHGYILCGMGERIMRTETAATVAGALILNAMGALEGK